MDGVEGLKVVRGVVEEKSLYPFYFSLHQDDNRGIQGRANSDLGGRGGATKDLKKSIEIICAKGCK
jgi:hypothetical protein